MKRGHPKCVQVRTEGEGYHASCVRTHLRARSLVVSDLRSETKGSRFESGCQLFAEVSSLQ